MGYQTSVFVKITVVLLLICTLSSGLLSFDGNNNGKDHIRERERERQRQRPSPKVEDQHNPPQSQEADRRVTVIDTPPSTIIEAAKTLFSLPSTRLELLQAAASNSWIKLKTLLLEQAQGDDDDDDLDDHHSAPSLERENDGPADTSVDSAGEVVKEAIVKSLDKSKEVIEDSARSAAKLAGDAMDTTAKKVKKTMSDKSSRSEAEL